MRTLSFVFLALMRLIIAFRHSQECHLFGATHFIKVSWADISLEAALRRCSPHAAKRQPWPPSNNAFGYLAWQTKPRWINPLRKGLCYKWVTSEWTAEVSDRTPCPQLNWSLLLMVMLKHTHYWLYGMKQQMRIKWKCSRVWQSFF